VLPKLPLKRNLLLVVLPRLLPEPPLLPVVLLLPRPPLLLVLHKPLLPRLPLRLPLLVVLPKDPPEWRGVRDIALSTPIQDNVWDPLIDKFLLLLVKHVHNKLIIL
jgi:hypothetical protein